MKTEAQVESAAKEVEVLKQTEAKKQEVIDSATQKRIDKLKIESEKLKAIKAVQNDELTEEEQKLANRPCRK